MFDVINLIMEARNRLSPLSMVVSARVSLALFGVSRVCFKPKAPKPVACLGDFAGRIFNSDWTEKSLAASLFSCNFGSCSPKILVLTSFEWRSARLVVLVQERPLFILILILSW